jgi:Spy/CpxP family protein refolding chaperone
MRKKVLLLLIVFSAALNVGFLATWAVRALPTFFSGPRASDAGSSSCTPMLCPLHEKLGVDNKQWEEIKPYYTEFCEERDQINRELADSQKELINLIAQPNPDQCAIRIKQEEIITGQRKIQRLVINQLLREKETLTPEQQERLFELIRQRCGCSEASAAPAVGEDSLSLLSLDAAKGVSSER